MRREQGQAGVETLLILPVLLLVALAGAETATWAASAVLAGSAAGAGARALARGDPVDAAARRELPGPFRGLARVTVEEGVVRVVLRVPMLVPGAPGLDASAEAGP
jgi:Flp pilus assembly protein TadG